LAFSSPTADGISFARNYCGSDTPLLVYDIWVLRWQSCLRSLTTIHLL
jgi:hypothetical protein